MTDAEGQTEADRLTESGLSTAAVSVLLGEAAYDDLSDADQASVRDEWDRAIGEDIASLNLEAEFRAAGRSWVEADADGNLIHRHP